MRVRDLRWESGGANKLVNDLWMMSQQMRSIRNPTEIYIVCRQKSRSEDTYDVDSIRNGSVYEHMTELDRFELAVVLTGMTEVT
ncbi:hypothetical protein [Methylobacterium sp. 285MFTsu5.1]|uniref:hypothetical protein n=1 Tax=Methylobacterium sp. 285MFTsu5.1 TaxID=1172187 RepID=UPI00036781CE|nr:hypothetical protein [Methylobacterium sp. 285MFTsu5.1]